MNRRPVLSEMAAAAWIAGGLAGTALILRVTGGEHSVSRGLREHPRAFALLTAAFMAHIYLPEARWSRFDPFCIAARWVRGSVHLATARGR